VGGEGGVFFFDLWVWFVFISGMERGLGYLTYLGILFARRNVIGFYFWTGSACISHVFGMADLRA